MVITGAKYESQLAKKFVWYTENYVLVAPIIDLLVALIKKQCAYKQTI